jgi:hypothetical protein
MAGFEREVLARLPLAKAVLSVLGHVCQEKFLDQVFGEFRGRCYERELKFSNLVDLIGDALLEYEGSARKAFREGRKQEHMPVTDQAGYGKLRRLPLDVSQGFLRAAAARLQELFPDEISSPLPKSLIDLQVFAVDGKKLKKLAKRLKAARGVEGKVLGGKALVARDLHLGIAVAMQSHLDGETNDGPLVPGLLKQIVELYHDENCLWVLDSQFCDLTTPKRILGQGHDFLVRYHPKVQFHRASSQEVREGTDERGRKYREEIGRLGSPHNKPADRLLVRRITVIRPGQDDLVLITSLLDMDAFPAVDLLIAYAARWTIETMFQHVTEVFCLQRLIGGTAEASVFQCCFCLLLFNIIHLLRIHLSIEHAQEAEKISMRNVFDDVHSELTAMRVLLSTRQVVLKFPLSSTPKQIRRQLRSLLKSVWEDHWLKAPKNHRNPPAPRRKVSGGHTSIYRLIKQHAAKPG